MQNYSLRCLVWTYRMGKQGLALLVPCASCTRFGKQQSPSTNAWLAVTATKDPDCLSCLGRDWRQSNVILARAC
ncbi:hypothetical protein M3J09_008094 [Ascochyta lentis]